MESPKMKRSYGDLIRFGSVQEHFTWAPETSELGAGTFGAVFKAQCTKPCVSSDMKVGDWYAIKVIKKEKLKLEKHWKAVFHEIEILKRIKSSYCIQLFDAFQDDDAVYLVLEYVDGGELFEFIIQRGHLTEQEAMQITKQLMEALRFLHCDQKIVHRDLKPENILMVKDTMKIKIIDFGFAKFYGQPKDQPFPITPNPGLGRALATDINCLSPGATIPNTPSELVMNTPLGSLKYCAPEILKRLVTHGVQARVTTRIDIQKLDMFAAGVVTYVMLGGSFPFSSKSKHALALQIERGIKFPESRFAGVSEEAKDFCRWMLDPDRKKRPLSYETCNHPWLRVAVPNTPLEVWESGDLPEPIDNAFFDEIREMDKELEKDAASPPVAEGEKPKDDAQMVAPRPKQELVLKLPKKGAKKPATPPAVAPDANAQGPALDVTPDETPPVQEQGSVSMEVDSNDQV